ncbi:hypothetical protein SAMN05518801_10697 [Novosphingobium sp. CF614]|uniref:TraB/GumN family protein n=1 Tax=Novosphingobium sp. CF614 TaxID=1884364 RepID=UPI0008E9B717|nr:TraB/GumN family protein [Novosphingobium sp. CF614]SFG04588.1 hypothetical protein SAMN05518801_10697 [Novosphingobium sp. CF614]
MTKFKTWLRAATCALAVLPAVPAPAQDTAPVSAAAAPEPARPALWKIADEDTTIWLFGTIHILPGNVDWYAGPIAAAFDASSELVTEIPIDRAQDSQAVFLQKSLRQDGKALRDTLSEKERAAYDAGMASIGLPPPAFDRNDAWFAALMLTLIPLKVAGYNLESGIDTQVGGRARARRMENAALESAEYQISLFDTLPEQTQRRYLDQVVEALPTVKSDIDAMVAAWKAGKADDLAHLLNEEEDDPKLRKVLLTDRNRIWAKWLKARLDKPGIVFVAVGAGHLAGKGSVQDQLARRGIKSVRVQ